MGISHLQFALKTDNSRSRFDSDKYEGYDLKIAVSPISAWAWPQALSVLSNILNIFRSFSSLCVRFVATLRSLYKSLSVGRDCPVRGGHKLVRCQQRLGGKICRVCVDFTTECKREPVEMLFSKIVYCLIIPPHQGRQKGGQRGQIAPGPRGPRGLVVPNASRSEGLYRVHQQ